MKKLLLGLAVLVALTGCSDGSKKEAAKEVKKETPKEVVYKVGTAASYPPFEFVKDTKITGFDIDFMTEIGNKVGFKCEFVNMGFDGLIPALKGGKIDIIASAMSATNERRTSVDFTDNYFSTNNVYLKQKNNAELTKKEQLAGKKLGAQLGTVQEMAAKKVEGVTVVPSEQIISSIMALKAGKVDAVIVDSAIGYGFLKENPELDEFFSEPDGSEGFSYAFDKDKHKELISKINDAIKALKADGTYDKLLEKYNLKK